MTTTFRAERSTRKPLSRRARFVGLITLCAFGNRYAWSQPLNTAKHAKAAVSSQPTQKQAEDGQSECSSHSLGPEQKIIKRSSAPHIYNDRVVVRELKYVSGSYAAPVKCAEIRRRSRTLVY